jgi:hypothetical protein
MNTAQEFQATQAALSVLDLIDAPADTVLYFSRTALAPEVDAIDYVTGETVVWLPSPDWYNTPDGWLHGHVTGVTKDRVGVEWDDGTKSLEVRKDIAPAFTINRS